MGEELRIWDLLERFRRTTIYLHVEWQHTKAKKFKSMLAERFLDLTKEELKDFLENYFMWHPGVEERQIRTILEENDFNDLKLRLLYLYIGKAPIKKKLEALRKLNGVGLFVATQFLSAVDEDYIVYDENVLEGIRELLPRFANSVKLELPERVSDIDDYLKFNEVCRSIRDCFGFRSLAEVHEFFWHGHDQGWQF